MSLRGPDYVPANQATKPRRFRWGPILGGFGGVAVVGVLAYGAVQIAPRIQRSRLPATWLEEWQDSDSALAKVTIYTPIPAKVLEFEEWDLDQQRRLILLPDAHFVVTPNQAYVRDPSVAATSFALPKGTPFSEPYSERFRKELEQAANPLSEFKESSDQELAFENGKHKIVIRKLDERVWQRESYMMRGAGYSLASRVTLEIGVKPNADATPTVAPASNSKTPSGPVMLSSGTLVVPLPRSMRGSTFRVSFATTPSVSAVTVNPSSPDRFLVASAGFRATYPLKLTVTSEQGVKYESTVTRTNSLLPMGIASLPPGDQSYHRLRYLRAMMQGVRFQESVRRFGRNGRPSGATGATPPAQRSLQDLQVAAAQLELAASMQEELGPFPDDPALVFWRLYLLYGELGERASALACLQHAASKVGEDSSVHTDVKQALERERFE